MSSCTNWCPSGATCPGSMLAYLLLRGWGLGRLPPTCAYDISHFYVDGICSNRCPPSLPPSLAFLQSGWREEARGSRRTSPPPTPNLPLSRWGSSVIRTVAPHVSRTPTYDTNKLTQCIYMYNIDVRVLIGECVGEYVSMCRCMFVCVCVCVEVRV